MKKLKPSYKHGIMSHPLNTGMSAGFYIENGNNSELQEFIDTHYKKQIDPTGDEELARTRLEKVRTEVKEQGYCVGEIEIKSHRDWCLEVFGVCPADEVEEEFDLEVDNQSV
jgi:hypothetical protein